MWLLVQMVFDAVPFGVGIVSLNIAVRGPVIFCSATVDHEPVKYRGSVGASEMLSCTDCCITGAVICKSSQSVYLLSTKQ